MIIAVCADEAYPVHATIRSELESRGHELRSFGAFGGGAECGWCDVAQRAGRAVGSGEAAMGVFLCWSGTGISMAANKVQGVRAALCADPGTARAARQWNDANVLCLSHRTLSDDMAREILNAWFEAQPLDAAEPQIGALRRVDARAE